MLDSCLRGNDVTFSFLMETRPGADGWMRGLSTIAWDAHFIFDSFPVS